MMRQKILFNILEIALFFNVISLILNHREYFAVFTLCLLIIAVIIDMILLAMKDKRIELLNKLVALREERLSLYERFI